MKENNDLSFTDFCVKEFVPFEQRLPFKIWLGNVAEDKLPLEDWYYLWVNFWRLRRYENCYY